MDRAACWPTVHRVAQSQTQLKQLSVHSRVTYRDCVCVCVCVCVCGDGGKRPFQVGETA